MKRLVLINPLNRERPGLSSVPRVFSGPPLALSMVAAMTPDDWQIEIIDEVSAPFRFRPADLVGLTATTSAAPRAYQIAAEYRRQKVPVVMGGIHASMCPDEAACHVDAVVVGEAEPVWAQVVDDAQRRHLEPIYRAEPAELAGLPQPRRELVPPNGGAVTVQTSRGCPMDCHFCSVSAMHGRRYRRRPVEEVLDELATICQKWLVFIDDNLVGYGTRDRQEALELFQGMVQRRFRFHWACQGSLNIADDDELLAWAARAGCKMIFVGFEAEDPTALAEMNKRVNLDRNADQYGPQLDRIHKAGIFVEGSFILGLDSDTAESLRRRVQYILTSNVDTARVSPLIPLPGTRIFERLRQEGRLRWTDFPKDWDRYDGIELAYRPLHFTERDLVRSLCEFATGYCRWPMLMRRSFRTLGDTRSLSATGMAAWLNLKSRRLRLEVCRLRQGQSCRPVAPGGTRSQEDDGISPPEERLDRSVGTPP